MSEKTEIPPLNPVAFGIAMIGGPLLLTLCTFWMAFIPVYAVVFGGIPYLVIGTPMALWMALTGPVTVPRAAGWAVATIVALTVLGAIGALAINAKEDAVAMLIFGAICMPFGAGWAAISGWIYADMTKPDAI
jgi:hypothetical protein